MKYKLLVDIPPFACKGGLVEANSDGYAFWNVPGVAGFKPSELEEFEKVDEEKPSDCSFANLKHTQSIPKHCTHSWVKLGPIESCSEVMPHDEKVKELESCRWHVLTTNKYRKSGLTYTFTRGISLVCANCNEHKKIY